MLYFKDNNFIKMFNLSTERFKKKLMTAKLFTFAIILIDLIE